MSCTIPAQIPTWLLHTRAIPSRADWWDHIHRTYRSPNRTFLIIKCRNASNLPVFLKPRTTVSGYKELPGLIVLEKHCICESWCRLSYRPNLTKYFRPVRTYNTAVVYYHKFRLLHPDTNGFIVSTWRVTLRWTSLSMNRMRQALPFLLLARSKIR